MQPLFSIFQSKVSDSNPSCLKEIEAETPVTSHARHAHPINLVQSYACRKKMEQLRHLLNLGLVA